MLVTYEAGAVMDAGAGGEARVHRPGAVAMRGGRVVAAGAPGEVRRLAGRADRVVSMPDSLLVPGLVNAHAHLDLTRMGRRPFDGDFPAWARMVRAGRPSDAAGRAAAIGEGLALSRAAGVLRIGDIVAEDADEAEVDADDEHGEGVGGSGDGSGGVGVGGVRFAELFGLGPPFDAAAVARIEACGAGIGTGVGAVWRRGWQPHAPYSAGPGVYAAASASGAPVSTHLAETRAELEFVATGRGPFRAMLESLGKWEEGFGRHYEGGLSPVAWLLGASGPCGEAARGRRWLCAHCNYVDDGDIALLAARGASVAYCPRSSGYFGHAGHRYREMLAAGVNVCLGTDSIVCHGSLGVVEEMRLLHRRDGVGGEALLAMATRRGARGLGLEPADAAFEPGRSPGLVALPFDRTRDEDALEQVLRADARRVVPRVLEVVA